MSAHLWMNSVAPTVHVQSELEMEHEHEINISCFSTLPILLLGGGGVRQRLLAKSWWPSQKIGLDDGTASVRGSCSSSSSLMYKVNYAVDWPKTTERCVTTLCTGMWTLTCCCEPRSDHALHVVTYLPPHLLLFPLKEVVQRPNCISGYSCC